MVNIDLINLGTGANTGDGDSLRVGAAKINQNFSNVLEFLESLEEDTNEDRLPNVFHVSIDGIAGNVGTSVADSVPSVKEAVELANAYVAANPSQSALVVIHPGQYTEQNPITVKRNISIYGKGLRVVDLVPQNPFESFFLVDSGFKAWGLSIIGMQADSTRQAWCFEFDANADNTGIGASGTGAYILKSPYIQNCSSYTAEDDAGQAGSTSTGSSGGGLKVDGNACAPNSPIRSMVVDSFTQVNLGGPGCLVTNDGYAQLVSFFGTFCTYHCKADKGGQINFTGGTTDFGNYGLVADGYSSEPMYTALATRAHYGASRVQKNFTLNTTTDVFTCNAHGLVLNDQVTFKALGGSLPAPLTQGTIYYARTITTNTFQVSTTSGGAALNITGSLVGNEDFEFTRQGELYIDTDNYTANRIGNDSRPGQGGLLFARLAFPRTGSLAADANTPGTVNSVYEDNGVFYADAVLDTAPAVVGKHEYVKNSGTVVVTRVGAFVDAQGNTIPTTPVAGLNTYTFIVTSVDYNHLTGLTRFGAFNYIPNANDSFYFVNTEYICQQSAMVITSAAPINQFGQVIPENDNTKVGYRVFVYNALNGGLRYPLADNQKLDFRRRSQISAPAHVFEYVGSGTNYDALPENGGVPIQANGYQELNNGRVFISWTNEKGDFGVSNRFLVDGTTGAVTIDASSLSLSGLSAIGPFSRNGGLSTVGVQALEISDNINMISSLGIPDINTIPTQTAVVGYIDSIFTGGSEVDALNINGVFFTAATDESQYPSTRPQLVPFQYGDMIWDASKRAWLGWSGTSFSNELSVTVLKDGSTYYTFNQATEPLFRNQGEPSQSALQNGDRWNNPGKFNAIYDNGVWISEVESSVANGLRLYTTPAFSNITNGVGLLSTDNGAYVVKLTGNDFKRSTDYGANWTTYTTPGNCSRFNIGLDGTWFYYGQSWAAWFLIDTPGLYYSKNQGATWTSMSSPSLYLSFITSLANGRFIHYEGAGGRINYSDDNGASWTVLYTTSEQIRAGAILANGTLIKYNGDASGLNPVIAYSTDGGSSWTVSATGIDLTDYSRSDAFVVHGNTIYYRKTNNILYKSDNYGVTEAAVAPASTTVYKIDNTNQLLYYSGGIVFKSPGSGYYVDYSADIFNFNAKVNDLVFTYKLQVGGAAHNATNFYTVVVTYTNFQTQLSTDYTLSLNDPYPTTTLATVVVPIADFSEFGASIKLKSIANVGNPGGINLTISLNGSIVYAS